MRNRPTENSNDAFVDLLASMLFVVVLALVVSLLRNVQAAEALARVKGQASERIAVYTRLGQDLQRGLGGLAEADPISGTVVVGEGRLRFALNSYEVTARGRRYLQRLSPLLGEVVFSKKYVGSIKRIVVEGHTDRSRALGDPYYNWRLSNNRATAVVEKLIEYGGQWSGNYRRVLETTGMADRRPIYGSKGRLSPAKSRRIVLRIELNDRSILTSLARDLGSKSKGATQ